jgi:hypothetical protein
VKRLLRLSVEDGCIGPRHEGLRPDPVHLRTVRVKAPTVRTVTPVRRRKPVITSSKCASNKCTPGYHILIGIFIATAVVDNADDRSGFDANHAWMYATWLTIGYMISRSLAKSGRSTRECRNDRD